METAGRRRRVPVMVGLNADEGVLNPGYFRTTPAEVRARAVRMAGEAGADALLAGVPLDDETAALGAGRQLTRLYGLASLIDWARIHQAPAFAYYYTHPEPGPGSEMFGAFHSAEIPYIFNSLSASPERPFTDSDRAIAATMSRLWATFVKRSNPNGPDLPQWPAFANTSAGVMELGAYFAPYRAEEKGLDLLLGRFANGPGRSIFGIESFAETSRER
jgi:para-nitrobenzyl esterase